MFRASWGSVVSVKLSLVLGAAIVLPALSGCSGDGLPWSDDEPTPTPTPTPVAEPAPDVPASGGGLTRSNVNDLVFVRKSAPPCAAVWTPGRRLDKDYEWCADEAGSAVAGVRIGACEVITFQNQLYAVPGYRIRVATAPIASDPRYLRELTSCKRTPVPAGQRPARRR